MLGGSDDLAAVLSVLDRLTNELESNREALDTTCERADDIGGGGSMLPDGAVGEESISEIRKKVLQEKQDCDYLRESLEKSVVLAANSVTFLRGIHDLQAQRELALHKSASEELLYWQTEVEKAADEYSELVSRYLAVSSNLTKLYEKLQVQIK